MTEEVKPPRLSVVIGSYNAAMTIVECLGSIERQRDGESVEVIVADYSTDKTAEIVRSEFPWVKLIEFERPMLIPELWGAGMARSTGEIVAVTTAHCVPADDWISEILKAHGSESAAVGGAIECSGDASLVDWAIYFCRYTPYMKPFKEDALLEVPGDNGSYKREALEGCRELWVDGFWETVVNARLRREGMRLFCTPSIVVYHKKSFSLAAFAAQRFRHGIHFGTTRAESMSPLKRAAFIVASPLIPFVFFSHIGRRVFAKKRHIKEFIIASPVLFLILIFWAAGEFCGYMAYGKTKALRHHSSG